MCIFVMCTYARFCLSTYACFCFHTYSLFICKVCVYAHQSEQNEQYFKTLNREDIKYSKNLYMFIDEQMYICEHCSQMKHDVDVDHIFLIMNPTSENPTNFFIFFIATIITIEYQPSHHSLLQKNKYKEIDKILVN